MYKFSIDPATRQTFHVAVVPVVVRGNENVKFDGMRRRQVRSSGRSPQARLVDGELGNLSSGLRVQTSTFRPRCFITRFHTECMYLYPTGR